MSGRSPRLAFELLEGRVLLSADSLLSLAIRPESTSDEAPEPVDDSTLKFQTVDATVVNGGTLSGNRIIILHRTTANEEPAPSDQTTMETASSDTTGSSDSTSSSNQTKTFAPETKQFEASYSSADETAVQSDDRRTQSGTEEVGATSSTTTTVESRESKPVERPRRRTTAEPDAHDDCESCTGDQSTLEAGDHEHDSEAGAATPPTRDQAAPPNEQHVMAVDAAMQIAKEQESFRYDGPQLLLMMNAATGRDGGSASFADQHAHMAAGEQSFAGLYAATETNGPALAAGLTSPVTQAAGRDQLAGGDLQRGGLPTDGRTVVASSLLVLTLSKPLSRLATGLSQDGRISGEPPTHSARSSRSKGSSRRRDDELDAAIGSVACSDACGDDEAEVQRPPSNTPPAWTTVLPSPEAYDAALLAWLERDVNDDETPALAGWADRSAGRATHVGAAVAAAWLTAKSVESRLRDRRVNRPALAIYSGPTLVRI